MKSQIRTLKGLSKKRNHSRRNGFSMTELVVSISAGSILMLGSGVALRSTESLIDKSKGKTTLRQNATNGMRLMRSEIERSMHLVLKRSGKIPTGSEHTDLDHTDYKMVLNDCQGLSSKTFRPIFGIKMIELAEPVIYGLTTSSDENGYSLQRCGAPLTTDGRYQEVQTLFLSPVLNNLAALPCSEELIDKNECPDPEALEKVVERVDFTFTDGKTPYRTVSEPALRIETDVNSKLVKFIDPTPDDDTIKSVFLQNIGTGNKATTILPTYFAAFSRADKRVGVDGIDGGGGVLSGAFFKNIISKRLRFVLDGSGSMSACVMWGEGYGHKRTYYDPQRGSYIKRRQNCAFTRMEAMQDELTTLLTDLSDDTKVGLRAFSTSGRANNKSWAPSSKRLVTIGEPGMRESAIVFINSLDDPNPGYWGGTKPWDAIQAAFNDEEVDTLYLLSDGEPNNDRRGRSWNRDDYNETANYYASQNIGRDRQLKVNSTALGLSSPWMEKLSDLTNGDYIEINENRLEGIESSD